MKIYNARIMTCEDRDYERGYIAFENGKICDLGDMADCPPVRPGDLDAEGGWLVPGFVDPHCHVGCGPEAVGTTEYSETLDPLVPHYDAADAFFPMDPAIPKCLRRGITTVVSGPGSTALIGGQLAAFKLNGKYAPEACVKRACAIKFALGEAPKSVFAGRGRGPGTRMASAALLRGMLDAAAEYARRVDAGLPYVRDVKCEALLPLMRGEIPAHVHAMRADDIRMMLELSENYGFKLVFVHGQQTVRMLEALRRAGAGVIHGPLMFTSRDMESDGISFRNPLLTQRAGILTAVCTDACPGLGSAQMLPVNASMAVREGLSPADALRLIAIDAAKTAGIDDRVGSLRVGKDADIALFDQMPLELTARTRAVFVDGRRVEQCV